MIDNNMNNINDIDYNINLVCNIEINNGLCGKDAIITMVRLGRTTNLCKEHYAVAVVDEIESSKTNFNSCDKCEIGLLEYRNTSYNENTKDIKTWYKCTNCGKYESYRREINNGCVN
jgi:hypothetical protein